jgi:hypothetical protein
MEGLNIGEFTSLLMRRRGNTETWGFDSPPFRHTSERPALASQTVSKTVVEATWRASSTLALSATLLPTYKNSFYQRFLEGFCLLKRFLFNEK